MAYTTRTRDPLLETHMQEAIRKRGTELAGLALIGVAVLCAMLLGSFSPDDPSWISATAEPAKNLLGQIGATLASPLFLTIGWAAWGIPLLCLTWGIRMLLHIGETRALSRVFFAPIALAVGAVFASAHVPLDSWQHSFGLGGLFGDAALGVIIDLNPMSLGFGVKLVTLILGVVFVALALFVLGFSMSELRLNTRLALYATILAYDNLIRLLGFTARGGATLASKANDRRQARRKAAVARNVVTQSRENPIFEAEETLVEPAHEAPSPRRSLLPTLPGLRRSAKTGPAKDPQEQEEPQTQGADQSLHQERVNKRISEAIRANSMRSHKTSSTRLDEPAISDNIFRETFDDGLSVAPALGGAFRDYDALSDQPEEEFGLFETQEEVPAETEAPVPAAEPKSVVQHQTRKAVKPSTKAQAEAQPSLRFEETGAEYETPPLALLSPTTSIVRHHLSDEALAENARMLETVLDDYGIKGEIVSVRPGPVVTMYELEPAPGLKASRVIGLADDIARSMSALAARVSTVPGRNVIGIELPNANRETVLLREILSARDYGDGNQSLPLALGKDIGGDPIVANLAKMPHLLIAGTTGSGKSVAINTMILSLLYKLTPEECRLIMIDPKMLELSVYDGIPHLLSPVVTDPKKAVVALKWVVGEMEERYRKMSKMGVRNIDGHNSRVADALKKGEDFQRTVQTGFDDNTGEPIFETETFTPEKMPFIVVVVDEMADLMMVAGKEIEACIQRLAQMARASGIHLIMATQRPSVDVITGTIKANFPTRISFQVTSKVDSRTILGEMGAEQLLGMGDMLFMAGGGKITRVHGPFVSDEEVEEIVNHLKSFGAPEYLSGVVEGPAEERETEIDQVLGLGGNTNGEDALYDQAVAIVAQDRKCSTSYIQRKLSIGYNKAAKLVEQMEDNHVVSSANHVGKREILLPEQ